MKRLLVLILSMILYRFCIAQNSSIGGIINSYSEVLKYDPCMNSILLRDASDFKAGDTVLLMQMKGAVIDSSNNSNFGAVLKYNNAGNYEFNIIRSITLNNVVLKNELQRNYDIPHGTVQLVRVPYYKSATVTSPLTAMHWDGTKGGVLAMNVKDTLYLQRNIDVNGRGFKGAQAINSANMVTYCSETGFNYPENSYLAATKGESITSLGFDKQAGKGAPASAGGGGVDHNSGGGGGANGADGGYGGYQLESCTGSAFDNRGIGGKKLSYSNVLNKVFLGGGGGAGHCNQVGGINMNGGNGGGIALIKATYIKSNGFDILAKGDDAVQCNLSDKDLCHDGSGGGGGGGVVLLEANSYLDNLDVNVGGGKGGDLIIFNNFGGGRIGPGGGGGGGVVWINSSSLPARLSVIAAGGKNGVITPDLNNPWGATAGSAGVNLFDLKIPVDVVEFQQDNIDSVGIQGPVNCNNIQFRAVGYTRKNPITSWQWDLGNGISRTASSVNYTYTNEGSYKVKLIGIDNSGCRDSAETVFNITTVNAEAVAVGEVCESQPLNLLGKGGSSYIWTPKDFLNNNAIENPIASITESTRFHLTVGNGSGCTDTTSIFVKVRKRPMYTGIDNKRICIGDSVEFNADHGTEYRYLWTPSTFLNNPTSPIVVAAPDQTIQYTLKISEAVCSYDTSFQISVHVNPKPIVLAAKSNDVSCNQPTARLMASGALNYSWAPTQFLDNATVQNPLASVETPTTFVVSGTDRFGCSSSDSIEVKIVAAKGQEYSLPNAFTPNSDGKNDCFGIAHWGTVQVTEFLIFNRWGQIVFSSKTSGVCWNGTFNGTLQEAGAYPYIIKAKTFCGSILRQGTIMLIR